MGKTAKKNYQERNKRYLNHLKKKTTELTLVAKLTKVKIYKKQWEQAIQVTACLPTPGEE